MSQFQRLPGNSRENYSSIMEVFQIIFSSRQLDPGIFSDSHSLIGQSDFFLILSSTCLSRAAFLPIMVYINLITDLTGTSIFFYNTLGYSVLTTPDFKAKLYFPIDTIAQSLVFLK